MLIVTATAACARGTADAAATTATATVTTSVPAAASPSASASGDRAVEGRRIALDACQTYVTSTSTSAAEGSQALDEAAHEATTAAVLDPSWTALAGSLGFLAVLPLTDNTADDVAQAAKEADTLQAQCATLGVTIS